MRAAAVGIALAALAAAAAAGQDPIGGIVFEVPRRAEVVATLAVHCEPCAWDRDGHEAVTLRLTLDGSYSQHLPVIRNGRAEYRVFLGSLEPGQHALSYDRDSDLTAREFRGKLAARVEDIRVEQVPADHPEHTAVSLAPFLYARPNTLGRFSDLPVFMWYEVEPAEGGTRYRYSVIFTNEDGGTPADRLMATWGRTTDIEYVYSVVVDSAGRIVTDDIQGPNHEILPFRGQRDGRHPRLWVTTDNNMVEDRGTTSVRYAPAPVAFPLDNVSREVVMDANPWLYGVAAHELARERKIVPDAPPQQGVIPDPRRYVYVEACGEAGLAALAFAVRAGDRWYASDRGVPEYRIVRAGCFRGAVPVPSGVDLSSVRALRFQAYERPYRPGAGQPTSERPTARLTHINKVFTLDEAYRPQASRFEWRGEKTLVPGGPPVEFPLP